MIESIGIVHSELQGGEYRLLAEFFRFAGISVYNYALSVTNNGISKEFEESELSVDEKFDVMLVIAVDQEQEAFGLGQDRLKRIEDKYGLNGEYATKSFLVIREGVNWHEPDEIKSKNARIAFLQKCVDDIRVQDKTLLSCLDIAALREIAHVYVDYDLLKYHVALVHFVNRDDIVQVVQKYYIHAYVKGTNGNTKDLEGNEIRKNQLLESIYYWYFTLNIARYINETCDLLDQKLIFDSQEQKDVLEELIEKTELKEKKVMIASMYMLIGYSLECDREFSKESGQYYEKALTYLAGSKLACYSHYRLGRFYEKVECNREKAIKEYNICYTLDRNAYRAIYKQADYLRKNQQVDDRSLEKAFTKYQEIETIFHEKVMQNRLQPKEYEYLYKAWFFMDSLYRIRPMKVTYTLTQEVVRKGMKDTLVHAQDEKRENPFFEQIFGAEATLDCSDDDNNRDVRNIRELTAQRIKQVCPS